jgi:serine/threonine protein kinase
MNLSDIKPSNILCNFNPPDVAQAHPTNRFSDVLLADFGSCVPATSDYAEQGDLIGAAMFRSPEANLHLPWGPSTDIWSFGAMVSVYNGSKLGVSASINRAISV